MSNNKKKVLHLLSSNSFSGAENVVCQIIDLFKDDDYDMVYCSPDGKIKEALADRDVKFLPIKKFNYFEIKKAVKEFNPDIIHAHDYKASIMAAMVSGKKKVISHLHNNVPFAKSWNMKSAIYYMCSGKYSKILAVSDAVIDEGVFFNEKNKAKSIVINNCLDQELIRKKATDFIPKENFDVVFIGRLTEQKNPIRFLRLIKLISEKKADVKAIMLGDGEMKGVCEEYIDENNLQERVILKGFVDNPFPYLKKAKVVILPSVFEGFGLVAVESMILGTPVINSGAGGLKSIFENDKEYICNTDSEYVDLTLKLLTSDIDYDFSKTTDKYTNKDAWKEKLIRTFSV